MSFTDHFTPLSIPNLGLVRFPTVTISPEERAVLGIKPKADNRTALKQLIWAGYKARVANGELAGYTEEQVKERLKLEFETFDRTAVHDYLLLVWDINRWADQQGIVRGWGRGSAAGSLSLFLLNITNVNPLRHNLNFPRFISEARMKPVVKDGVTYVDGKSAPDIDCDYQYLRRADVVRYIETKYAGHTCKISTRLELTGKMAIKDALKIYSGYSDEEAKRVSDFIEVKYGKVQTLHEAKTKNADLKKWLAASPSNQEVYAIAMAIEGLPVAKGQHPSGVFISFAPLEGNIPTERSKTDDTVTSYDMETVAGLGVKVDILGIRTLDLVAGTAALAGEKLSAINIDDPCIYDYLRSKSTYVGLFQIEEGTTKEATVKIGPKTIDDLSAALAISRPGALKYLDQYAEFARKGVVKPIYPAIDEVLKDTGNVLIYQEQITRVCQHVFGLSGIDADSVRYAVGKKKKEDMAKWQGVLFPNGQARGIPDPVTTYFWDVCNASADYLFVLAHAVCYAYLTAVTTYLKAKYPTAFYLTALKLAREEPNPIEVMNTIIGEMNGQGIKILPPDLLKSSPDFTIEDGHIRFGLSSIKSVSDITMAKLASFRDAQGGQPFPTKFRLFEAAKAAKVNIAVLSGLIYCGCISWPTTPSRAKLVLEAQTYNLLTDNEKGLIARFADEYGQDLLRMLKELPARTNEKGKPLIRASRIETLRRDYAPFWAQYQANHTNERLTSYVMERTYLGFSYTTTLHQTFSEKVVGLTPIAELDKVAFEGVPPAQPGKKRYGNPISFVAFVEEAKQHVSQASKQPYLRLQLYDDSATVKAMCFGEEKLEACRAYNEGLPEAGDIVIVQGKMADGGGMCFCDSCIVQANPIRIKKGAAPVESTP